MRACFPVAHDRGLDTRLYPHFGSAPMFLIADTETRETRAVVNGRREHEHGRCQPLAGLAQERIDAVAVSGIGPGALDKLWRANVAVYRASRGTVREVLDSIARGELQPVGPRATAGEGLGCAGHGDAHDHGGERELVGGPCAQHRHRHHGG